MAAILNAILCWLRDFFGTLNDIVLDSWDSVSGNSPIPSWPHLGRAHSRRRSFPINMRGS